MTGYGVECGGTWWGLDDWMFIDLSIYVCLWRVQDLEGLSCKGEGREVVVRKDVIG